MQTKIKVTLSQAAIAGLFFLGFLLGVVIAAAALLGSQIPLKCFEAGNAADWFAAIGTWVIGFGAWVYARNTFLRAKQVDADRTRALLRKADHSAKNLQMPHEDLDRMQRDPSDPCFQMVRSMLLVADTYRDVVEGVSWSEAEYSLLTGAEAGEALSNLEVCLRLFKTTIALFLNANSRDDATPAGSNTAHLSTLISSAGRLHAAATVFRRHVAVLRKQAGDLA